MEKPTFGLVKRPTGIFVFSVPFHRWFGVLHHRTAQVALKGGKPVS
jgi:hypothetical protein